VRQKGARVLDLRVLNVCGIRVSQVRRVVVMLQYRCNNIVMCVGTRDHINRETGAEYYSNRISDARYSCIIYSMCIIFYSHDRLSVEDLTVLRRNHDDMFAFCMV